MTLNPISLCPSLRLIARLFEPGLLMAMIACGRGAEPSMLAAPRAVRLKIGAVPTSVISGVAFPGGITVTIEDSLNNLVPSSTAMVSLSIANGSGVVGAALGGTVVQPAVEGVARFDDLTLAKAGSGYRLTATSTGLQGDTSAPMSVVAGAGVSLAFDSIGAIQSAGVPFAPAVRVNVHDVNGNLVLSANAVVAVAVDSGSNTPGLVLDGTVRQSAINGVATFTNVALNKPGDGYTLRATSGTLSAAVSGQFTVTPGPPAKLAFIVPPTQVGAGTALNPGPAIEVLDAMGNTVTQSTASVSLSIAPGTGTPGAVLSGGVTHAASNGVATFADLSIDRAGIGYQLQASVPGLASVSSVAFAISGRAVRLAFAVEPSPMVFSGSAISPAVALSEQDSLGTTVLSGADSITLTVTSGSGSPSPVIRGAPVQRASRGVAKFGDYSIITLGSGYILTASANGIRSAASSVFSVEVGPPATLAVTAQPNSAIVDVDFATSLQVAVLDSGGNVVTSATPLVSLSLSPGSAVVGAQLSGNTSEVPVGGVASFNAIRIGRPGDFTLSASAPAIAGATSAVIHVVLRMTTVSAGGFHVCGLTQAGSAYCWGSGFGGQLGNGSTLDSPVPVPVSGNWRFVQLSAGYDHTCGLIAGGTALCWGNNRAGQLGDGSSVLKSAPVLVAGGLAFTQLSADSLHTCGLTAAGSAFCWGATQLVGGPGSGFDTTLTPHQVSGATLFTALALGGGESCGLDSNGSAFCWGDSYVSASSTPQSISGGGPFTQLVVGGGHACGLDASGVAHCWGDDTEGALGADAFAFGVVNGPPPVAASLSLLFSELAAGGDHTCGLNSAGAAYCWGRNTSGQLGEGSNSGLGIWSVSGGLAFTHLTAGTAHTCGLTTAGLVYCWGANDGGQLGDGTLVAHATPTLVTGQQ